MIRFTADDRILVTGASSGLGAASAVLLNSLGATVIGVGRDGERLASTRALCPHPDAFHAVQCDLEQDVEGLVGWVRDLRQSFGKLCGLLYSAGRSLMLPAARQTAADMRQLYDLNVFALYQVARGFLDRRNNTGAGASVVLIASTSAQRDNAALSAYASSKGAVVSLAHSLACEYMSQGIRVNSLSPAFIPTPMSRRQHQDADAIAASYPLGAGCPEDVARAAAFLLSSASRWITGQDITLDGGRGLV